mgnify:CR=1 FL=1
MAYAQHFGLSRNSPLNFGGENDSKEIIQKVDTDPDVASNIIEQNNNKSNTDNLETKTKSDWDMSDEEYAKKYNDGDIHNPVLDELMIRSNVDYNDYYDEKENADMDSRGERESGKIHPLTGEKILAGYGHDKEDRTGSGFDVNSTYEEDFSKRFDNKGIKSAVDKSHIRQTGKWDATSAKDPSTRNILSQGSIGDFKRSKATTNEKLDVMQEGLSYGGFAPVFGAIPDWINSAVSGGRAAGSLFTGDGMGGKHSKNMAKNFVYGIPGGGDLLSGLAKGKKLHNKMVKPLDNVNKFLKSKGTNTLVANKRIKPTKRGTKRAGTEVFTPDSNLVKNSKLAMNVALKNKNTKFYDATKNALGKNLGGFVSSALSGKGFLKAMSDPIDGTKKDET